MTDLMMTTVWAGSGFLLAVVFSSFFEWTLHRYVMHKPLKWFYYPFRTHALIHHQVFSSDHTYHLVQEKDKWTIPMAWWNGPVLVAVCHLPFLITGWCLGRWSFVLGALAACGAYFAAYEYMHWCMHLPRRRNIERAGLFFRLNGHHILHHRYMHKNFNVVLPLADLLLGTLLLRSKVAFAQPRGASVPDVQPRAVHVSWPRRFVSFVGQCLSFRSH